MFNFSFKVYKSFVICKTVSKHAVIYALNLCYANTFQFLHNSYYDKFSRKMLYVRDVAKGPRIFLFMKGSATSRSPYYNSEIKGRANQKQDQNSSFKTFI